MSMVDTVAVQVLFGLYLGVLTGIIPALVAWTMGFVFKYTTGFTVPGLGVVVLAAALAGVSGGLMGLLDPAVSSTWTGVTALLIVLMMALWAHGHGDKMGADFPKRITLRSIRERTLSSDVVDRVGRFGQVRIRVTGPIGDMEDYPPVPAHLRRRLQAETWTVPADLSIDAMEEKVTEHLLADYDLADVSVTIDERGNATVAAAPAPGGLSRRLSAGRRAVSLDTLVPSGVDAGDEVVIRHTDGVIEGTVVSVEGVDHEPDEDDESEQEPSVEPAEGPATAGAAGGEGRLTVAVTLREARTLLASEQVGVAVRSRGKRREYELLSLLKRSGNAFRKIRVADGSAIADTSIGESRIRDAYGVVVLAIRRPTERVVGPRGDVPIRPGDDLYVTGPREAIDGFEEAVG